MGTYLQITVSGHGSLRNEFELECYCNIICDQENVNNLLIDMRQTIGMLSPEDARSLTAEIGDYHRGLREAIVDVPAHDRSNEVFRLELVQRGFQVNWFHNMDDAIRWLHPGNA